jgi:hypothetical protein
MKSKKCLICSGPSVPIKRIAKYNILKCGVCRMEFTDPMPSQKELGSFYFDYRDFHAPDHTVASNAKKNIKFLKKHGLTRKMRLLDYGCGKNLFVAQGKSKNWHGYDEYNENCDVSLLKGGFDFITLWGVLEHLPDPVGDMKMLARMLNPKGRLALTTVSSQTGIPYRHKPPEHLTYWTKEAMQRLFRRCGLKMLEYDQYFMYQSADIYLRCIWNAAKVPERIRKQIRWHGKQMLLVPTNEVIVLGVPVG